MMVRVCTLLSLIAISSVGCGDDRPPSASFVAPAGVSSIAGSQIARSGSFLLVSNVALSNQPDATGPTGTVKSGLGGQ